MACAAIKCAWEAKEGCGMNAMAPFGRACSCQVHQQSHGIHKSLTSAETTTVCVRHALA
jgi:hypothetical protein